MTPTYTSIYFNLSDSNNCCGILELGQFTFHTPNFYNRIREPVLATEELFSRFDTKLRRSIWDHVGGNNDGGKNPGYYWVQCSVVPTDGEHITLLLQHLKDTKWKTIQKFQNHNTTNIVYVMGKKFKYTTLQREFDEDD